MKSHKKFTVACLSGDGIGPELMAEASRAVAEAGRLHRFRVEEVHVPFAGEAISRHGHPLPAETRAACRRADAVLVALTKEPALEGVKAELDLTWRVQRVRLADGDIAVVSPLEDQMEPYVVRRAFDRARSRRAKVAAVGDGQTWNTFVGWEAERHHGVEVERLSLSEALPRLMNAPDGFCVVVTQRAHAELVSDLTAASSNGSRIVASGRLSHDGPGVFGPTWIGDRLCMDGAMCSTSTHVDLVAGAKRALVVALTDKGPRFSNIPNDIEQELRYVEAEGTKTLLIAADPGKVHLLSPAEIEPALNAGRDRALREADRVKAFWA